VVVDTVRSYFGMRTVSIGRGMNGTSQLLLNGRKFFAAGWLDQSFWPDGQYTAPTDAALAFDLAALKQFGMNTVRLHQKINPDRWYFHADRLGVVVLQDMVQHFNYRYAGTWIKNETIQNLPINTTQFTAEWTSAIRGLKNHPAIIQWNIFNEGEYEQHAWGCTKRSCPILDVTRALDQTRLVDFDSGGGGNNLGIGDANDVHSYGPDPTSAAAATPSRYGMVRHACPQQASFDMQPRAHTPVHINAPWVSRLAMFLSPVLLDMSGWRVRVNRVVSAWSRVGHRDVPWQHNPLGCGGGRVARPG
jgi:hypothetical protein